MLSLKVTLQNINFILKFSLALLFFAFALWYDNVLYNIIIASILTLLVIKERISLFRFPRQLLIFSVFLVMIFLFQSVSGYGKILLNLPLNITITEEGILIASTFVTQILLIFLLFGSAIYSSKKEEIFYYFKKTEKLGGSKGQVLERLLRIGMFAFYILPKSLRVQEQFSARIRSDSKIQSRKIVRKAKAVLDHIYQFIYAIIKSTEREYPEFIVQKNRVSTFSPQPVVTLQNGSLLLAILFIHGILIWQH